MNNRITNVNTLSALFDRLITENIKLFFFKKENQSENVAHQVIVIDALKSEISALFNEILLSGEYNFIGEKRTFDENAIVEELEQLIQNDINIGEADRARLEEVQKDMPDLERIIVNEKRLRKANEGRARNKNTLDKLIKSIFGK